MLQIDIKQITSVTSLLYGKNLKFLRDMYDMCTKTEDINRKLLKTLNSFSLSDIDGAISAVTKSIDDVIISFYPSLREDYKGEFLEASEAVQIDSLSFDEYVKNIEAKYPFMLPEDIDNSNLKESMDKINSNALDTVISGAVLFIKKLLCFNDAMNEILGTKEIPAVTGLVNETMEILLPDKTDMEIVYAFIHTMNDIPRLESIVKEFLKTGDDRNGTSVYTCSTADEV